MLEYGQSLFGVLKFQILSNEQGFSVYLSYKVLSRSNPKRGRGRSSAGRATHF
jgi:hypothetical protein